MMIETVDRAFLYHHFIVLCIEWLRGVQAEQSEKTSDLCSVQMERKPALTFIPEALPQYESSSDMKKEKN